MQNHGWLTTLLWGLAGSVITSALFAWPISLYLHSRILKTDTARVSRRQLWLISLGALVAASIPGILAQLIGGIVMLIAFGIFFYLLYSILKDALAQILEGDNAEIRAGSFSRRVTGFVFLAYFALGVGAFALLPVVSRHHPGTQALVRPLKEGLWERRTYNTTLLGSQPLTTNLVLRICRTYGPDVVQTVALNAAEASGCTSSQTRMATGYSSRLVCANGSGVSTTLTTVIYSGETGYHSESHTITGDRETRGSIVDENYLGVCPPYMKPGETWVIP